MANSLLNCGNFKEQPNGKFKYFVIVSVGLLETNTFSDFVT